MTNVYTSSDAITQAFLPSRGMRFQGAGDVRVHDWQPAKIAGMATRQVATATQLPGSYPNASTTGSGQNANGTISGGVLRPGAIDQSQFKAMLNAASQQAPGSMGGAGLAPFAPVSGRVPLAPTTALSAQGLQPMPTSAIGNQVADASSGTGSAIQTLTPAQFAALTGGASLPADGQPNATASASGNPALPADTPAAFRNLPADTLTMTDAAIPPDGAEQQVAATATTVQPGESTATAQTPIGTKDANGVLALNEMPDRETRQEYAAKGIKWKLVDNPASNKLFFGPDGKFGWDDIVDLINPLQHIPLVNIAYRHFTGDQINGSAELLGAIPFGPLGAISAIADLAVRSTTGKDIGENAIAMLTGNRDASNENLASVATPASSSNQAPAEQLAMNTAATSTDSVLGSESGGDRSHDQGRG